MKLLTRSEIVDIAIKLMAEPDFKKAWRDLPFQTRIQVSAALPGRDKEDSR